MKELLENINHILRVLDGTRINDFGDFHKKIMSLINPVLPIKFKYHGYWTINFNGYEVFKLNFEFIEDKRVKAHNRRGRLVKCWFEQTVKGETIPEIEKNIERKKLDATIEAYKEDIEEQKMALKDTETELEKLLAEKASWDK